MLLGNRRLRPTTPAETNLPASTPLSTVISTVLAEFSTLGLGLTATSDSFQDKTLYIKTSSNPLPTGSDDPVSRLIKLLKTTGITMRQTRQRSRDGIRFDCHVEPTDQETFNRVHDEIQRGVWTMPASSSSSSSDHKSVEEFKAPASSGGSVPSSGIILATLADAIKAQTLLAPASPISSSESKEPVVPAVHSGPPGGAPLSTTTASIVEGKTETKPGRDLLVPDAPQRLHQSTEVAAKKVAAQQITTRPTPPPPIPVKKETSPQCVCF